jgi:hypothetical protein
MTARVFAGPGFSRASRWSPLLVLMAMTLAAPAFAANARLERVVLLPSVDRSSIVFELSAEPRHVLTRRISDSVIEFEAGPGVESVAPKLLKAPANVRFIDSVTVRVLPTAEGPVVRARIALSALAQAVVRSAGRRVYVDISAIPAPAPGVAPPAPIGQVATAARPPASSPRVTPEEAFRTAVRPSLDKLKEMGPFMTSAAASADPKVTSAILPSLLTLRSNLADLQPPEAARGSHTMVLNAVDRILRALAPEFSGDRTATVKQSVTTIEVVGGVLAGR